MARHGRLSAGELAEAAVLGDVALVLSLAGWFLPLGAVLFAAASVPFAALAMRRRFRAVIVSGIATGQVAFLLGGVNLEINVVAVAMIGAGVGYAYRRGWRRGGTVLVTVPALWIPGAAASVAFLAVFSDARRLTLEQFDIGSRSARHLARRIGWTSLADAGDTNVHWAMAHWWFVIPVAELAALLGAVLICRRIAVPALRRLDDAFGRPVDPAPRSEKGAVAPLPARARGVSMRYGDASAEDGPVVALDDVDLDVDAGEFIVVVGPNGSGKSTLARLLGGRPPTTGTVDRPGGCGVGERHGTAMVFQRPESQVLGVRAAEDIAWAGGVGAEAVSAALARVGLEGFEERETATLSGGELQRLAIASALARQPALLIADEATAMLDPEGRAKVVEVLRGAARDGVGVVLVTHHVDDAAMADRVVALAGGRVVADGTPAQLMSTLELLS